MTPEAAGAVAAAVLAFATALGLLPKLLKGDLLFRREHEAIVTLKDAQIAELKAALVETRTELKAQHEEAAKGARELVNAVEFLQSLHGLQFDRRRAGD